MGLNLDEKKALVAEVGAKVDEVADVIPAAGAQGIVRRGDVEAFRRDHQPVQADECQPFAAHDPPELSPLLRRDRGRIFGERCCQHFAQARTMLITSSRKPPANARRCLPTGTE